MSWWMFAGPSQAAGPTSPPTISGIPEVGQTLVEAHGTWPAPAPTSFTYQWQRCHSTGTDCTRILGADNQTYVLVAADAGSTIRVVEFAGGSKARSAPTAIVTFPTTTEVLTTPAKPVSNDPVTLTATVMSSDGTKGPSGAITFDSGATPISGCVNLPVTPAPTTPAVTLTCQTSFAASIVPLTAVFAPGAGSNLSSSTSATDVLTVGRAATSTTLDVSTTADVGESTTYTADVAQLPASLGPIEPTGAVEFFDGGQPIASCLSQPLVSGGATCTVTYRAPGAHSITAQYGGDGNFNASAASAQPVNAVELSVAPSPVGRPPAHRISSITSTIQWTFYYTPTYTTALALVINGASGDTVLVNCHGRGCPFTRHTTRVNSRTRCGAKGTRTCPTHGRIDLAPRFEKHRLSIGAQIIIAITRPGWIGKYYVFTVRAGRIPAIKIACLAPGATRPHLGSNGRATSCG